MKITIVVLGSNCDLKLFASIDKKGLGRLQFYHGGSCLGCGNFQIYNLKWFNNPICNWNESYRLGLLVALLQSFRHLSSLMFNFSHSRFAISFSVRNNFEAATVYPQAEKS
jgi:hypothetical protein